VTVLVAVDLEDLRAWIAYSGRDARLSFWRTRSGVEVDFVVYGAEVFLAIQVQNAARVRPSDVQALRAFRSEFPESTPLLLYRGADRLRVDEVWCIPVERFLRGLHPSRGLTDPVAGTL
jgi:predicted AAA+ superfamily ATPase